MDIWFDIEMGPDVFDLDWSANDLIERFGEPENRTEETSLFYHGKGLIFRMAAGMDKVSLIEVFPPARAIIRRSQFQVNRLAALTKLLAPYQSDEVDLLSCSACQVEEILGAHITQSDGAGICCDAIGLGVYASGFQKDPDERVEAISFARPGYWSQVAS